MSLKHIADHIAAQGRHGDSTLVHVSKGELAGLQALAEKHGTTLTINPHTGLPEAFGMRQLLPMAAGAALTAAGVPAPVAIGLVGGGTYLATGSLQQGVMAGLGAWGGAGLAGGAMAAGTQEVAGEEIAKEAAKNQAEERITEEAAKEQLAKQTALNATGQTATTPQAIENVYNQQVALNAQVPAYNAANAADMSFVNPNAPLPASTYGATATPEQLAAAKTGTAGTELFSKGVSSLGTEAGRNAAYANMGGGLGVAKYGAAAAAPIIYDELLPKQVGPQVGSKVDADKGRQYSFSSGYDPITQTQVGPAQYTQISDAEANKRYWSHAAQGGLMKSYAAGGGISEFDFAGTGDGPITRMSDGGLPTMMDAQFREVLTRGKTQNAAAANPGQQYSYDQDSGEYVKRMASGGKSRAEQLDTVSNAPAAARARAQNPNSAPSRGDQISGYGSGVNTQSYMPTAQDYTGYYSQPVNSNYAAPVSAGYESNAGGISGYEPTGLANVSGYGGPSAGNYGYDAPVQTGIQSIPTRGFQYDPAMLQSIQDKFNPAPAPAPEEAVDYSNYDAGMGATGGSDGGGEAKGGLMHEYAMGGGISTLGSYSDGGRLLKGPGDGMSDNIPAQIGQRQPARLADGEFVVPADVVSHLGNGSTDAGAKQLYSMMDKIRKARTGRKAQGKQINPRKYMPA